MQVGLFVGLGSALHKARGLPSYHDRLPAVFTPVFRVTASGIFLRFNGAARDLIGRHGLSMNVQCCPLEGTGRNSHNWPMLKCSPMFSHASACVIHSLHHTHMHAYVGHK